MYSVEIKKHKIDSKHPAEFTTEFEVQQEIRI